MAPPSPSRRALLEVVGICAVVWAVLSAHAFGAGPLNVAGLTLRPGPLPEAVYGETRVAEAGLVPLGLARSMVPQAAAAPGGSAPGEAAPAQPIDASPQRILMFGDSMIEELMLRMADYCQQNGHELVPAVWYAAGTLHWAQHDRLDRLIAAHDPTIVIAVLGSNELTTRNIHQRAGAVRQIVTKVGDRPLLWIGPPNWTEDTGINALIERSVGRSRFFRSADLDLDRKPDGVHPTRAASATWMDAVARWIVRESAHPFRLSTPEGHAPRPAAQVFAPPGRG